MVNDLSSSFFESVNLLNIDNIGSGRNLRIPAIISFEDCNISQTCILRLLSPNYPLLMYIKKHNQPKKKYTLNFELKKTRTCEVCVYTHASHGLSSILQNSAWTLHRQFMNSRWIYKIFFLIYSLPETVQMPCAWTLPCANSRAHGKEGISRVHKNQHPAK